MSENKTKESKETSKAQKSQSKSQTPSKEELEKQEANQAVETREEKKRLNDRLSKAKSRRAYVPKNGTGKFFHAYVEIVQHNKAGKKVSETTVSRQGFETFLAWIKQAARLGYSFGMAHDPYRFYPENVIDQIKNAVKGYVKTVNLDNLEYAVNNLASGDGVINKCLKDSYKKRLAHIESKRKKAKDEEDYLD